MSSRLQKHPDSNSDPFAWPQPRSLLADTAVASIAYIVCFLVVHHLLYPAQVMMFGNPEIAASLLFLPHGVRVLAAWFLGWRSVIALAPGALIMHLYLLGEAAFAARSLMAFFVGISVAAATFHVFRIAGWDLRAHPQRPALWVGVMLVGLISSGANAVLTNLAFGSSASQYVGYLIGDFFGLFFLMLALMFLFRYVDRHPST